MVRPEQNERTDNFSPLPKLICFVFSAKAVIIVLSIQFRSIGSRIFYRADSLRCVMNYRLSRIFILVICFGFIFTINNQSVHSQPVMPDASLIAYLNGRLSGLQKPGKGNGQTTNDRLALQDLCPVSADDTPLRHVAAKVLMEYGAIFAGDNNVFLDFALFARNNSSSLVARCIFMDEVEVERYQSLVKRKRESIGNSTIELEENAMAALMVARRKATEKGINITPRGGSIAARRSFADTQRLWDSRFYSGLRRWAGNKITRQEAEQAKLLPPIQQIASVLEWEEKRNAFFSTDFSKSILYSVAAPGTSQHLFMLAIDIEQYYRKDVRDILASSGWYQTVKSDLPHFTYLGITDKTELRKRGLKSEEINGYEFWTPKID